MLWIKVFFYFIQNCMRIVLPTYKYVRMNTGYVSLISIIYFVFMTAWTKCGYYCVNWTIYNVTWWSDRICTHYICYINIVKIILNKCDTSINIHGYEVKINCYIIVTFRKLMMELCMHISLARRAKVYLVRKNAICMYYS